jgi:hypothetical protein
MGTVLGLLVLLVAGVLVALGLLHLGFLVIDRINPNPKPPPRPLSPTERLAFLAEVEALDRKPGTDDCCKHHDH